MKKSTKLILHYLLGMLIGGAIVAPLLWTDSMKDVPLTAKIGFLLICLVLCFYHFMTHRTADKERIDFQKFL